MVDIQKKVSELPTTPGVYLYKDASDTIIYVGKAVNLRRRVKQYFEKGHTLSPKTEQLVSTIADLDHKDTVTEFDALLLESNLIRTYQPKYNMIAKDDKSPIYIHVSLEDNLPRIQLTRKPKSPEKHTFYAGPFQSTRVAKSILRSIRRCIPYCTQKQRTGKPCFYTHINLCSPCPSEIVKMPEGQPKQLLIQQYRKNIFKIKRILEGNILPVANDLEQEMNEEAKNNHFEQAAQLRDRIIALQQLLLTHFDPSLYLDDAVTIGETVEQELKDLRSILITAYPTMQQLQKIECVDISNNAGTDPVGSLVVMEHGIIDRSQYRRFAIRDIVGSNDTAMINQVVERRLKHKEWSLPDLLVIDGGKGQVKAAEQAIKRSAVSIPIIGLAKKI